MSSRLAILLAVLVLVILGAGVVVGYLKSEFTRCFGAFPSESVADRASEAARTEGYEARVDRSRDKPAVTFESGETGADAKSFIAAFHGILRRHAGTRSHPGSGCLERPHFD